jgi:hypothetical protein
MEKEPKKMSPEYREARNKLAELAAAYIAAVNTFGLESEEAQTAYSAYAEQLKYFKVFDWL